MSQEQIAADRIDEMLTETGRWGDIVTTKELREWMGDDIPDISKSAYLTFLIKKQTLPVERVATGKYRFGEPQHTEPSMNGAPWSIWGVVDGVPVLQSPDGELLKATILDPADIELY